MKTQKEQDGLCASSAGQPLLTQSIINKQECVLSPFSLREEYENQCLILFKQMSLIEQETTKLTELQSLLLARMGNIKQ